jgi:hypothetical protein
MERLIPFFFIACAATGLLACISFVWSSLRHLMAADHSLYVTESAATRHRADLVLEKDVVLRGLKDLEFEREVGKLSDEDFARVDAEFRARAKRILRALDDDLREHKQKARALLDEARKAAAKGDAP